MITLLIGQRGVGKTTFLNRCKSYFLRRGLHFEGFDLDAEVENSVGLKVSEIFAAHGEQFFRQKEIEILFLLIELCQKQSADEQSGRDPLEFMTRKNHFIAVGAGYEGPLPDSVKVLWLHRNSDHLGRIFFDRPRLAHDLSAYEEFMVMSKERQLRYANWAHEDWWPQEAEDNENFTEELLLGLKSAQVRGSFTILSYQLRDATAASHFLSQRLSWGIDQFEVRDDLLNEQQVHWVLEHIPREKILWSRRVPSLPSRWRELMTGCALDCDIDIEDAEQLHADILSSHHPSLPEVFLQMSTSTIYKYAPLVNNWSQLIAGHKWYLEDPEHRVFLPRSDSGRWQWYRLLHKNKMHLNFWREGFGSSADQPTLSMWQSFDSAFEGGFHALLGDPIHHSHTPVEHRQFFKDFSMNTMPVSLSEDELTRENFEFLERLGMKAASVTAPLKKKMVEFCDRLSLSAQNQSSVNTIVLSLLEEREWVGENTDIIGFKEAWSELQWSGPVVIWGGGGVVSSILANVKNASHYSARSGDLKSGPPLSECGTLIWCVDRAKQSQCGWPPLSWRPHTVFDMNYAENSPGREYALQLKANYISGLGVFQSQALWQRNFWTEHL